MSENGKSTEAPKAYNLCTVKVDETYQQNGIFGVVYFKCGRTRSCARKCEYYVKAKAVWRAKAESSDGCSDGDGDRCQYERGEDCQRTLAQGMALIRTHNNIERILRGLADSRKGFPNEYEEGFR